jgi:hypothetical protein
MAELLLKSSLNPSMLISIRVTLRQVVIKGLESRTLSRQYWGADPVWILEATTAALDCDGETIPTEWVYLSSFSTVDEEVQNLVNKLAKKVCWENQEDIYAPQVVSTFPENGSINVPVDTNINIIVRDKFPSSAINPKTFKVTVKGFDLTHLLDIEGGPFEYRLCLTPGTYYKSAVADTGDCGDG